MEIKSQLIYDGSKLREFLLKNKMTYQDASERLDIDKNTIGKAVRGGNLNTSILLKICNEFNLNLMDFFTFVEDKDNLPISNPYDAEKRGVDVVSDKEEDYSASFKRQSLMEKLLLSKEEEIKRLKALLKLYEDRMDILQNKVLKGEM
ncbi:MAG: helix-turn-helix transcriptional regulator [Bacteroidales bacterium]|nr:helix-turn-helix transcriptional regulator [Bacteroidales bacterium]